jgi:ABC-type Na+ transport system ATPase subunit NatA
MAGPIIRTEHLSRFFSTVKAVDDLSLEVPAGIVFGFLGPNGAGKTTTIHLLLGLLEPTQGQASVLGFDTRTQADEIRTRIGALLEFAGLYERMTAEDNLDFYGRIYHMPAAERRARIKELLTHLDLWDRRKDQVGKWSRGMKQKLAVARALLHHPPLIFLDEPTAGFDPVAAATLHNDLANLVAREGVTVFLTTHNLTEAEKLSLLLGLLLVDLFRTQGNWMFYPLDLFVDALVLILLVSVLGASAGLLISLRVSTVRQAQQILSVGTIVFVFGSIFVLQAVPANVLSSLTYAQFSLIVMAVIAVLDAILLGLSLVSFQRSRLILS